MLLFRPTPARRPRFGSPAGVLESAEDRPWRRFRLCRQTLWSETTQAAVLAALALSLTLFARSLLALFARHGSAGNPWLPRVVLGLLAVVILITLRRLLNRLRNLRALRAELAALKVELRGDAGASEH